MNTVYVPDFTYTQVKQNFDDTIEKIFSDNVLACINSWESNNPQGDMILICRREKMDDGNYRMGMMCTKINDVSSVIFSNRFTQVKEMVIVFGQGIAEAAQRVAKNLAFI